MADDNWKTRVGIEINFSSDDEDTAGVEQRYAADDLASTLSPISLDSPDSSFESRHFFADDILNKYADYGSTPPRTRIARRQKERKQQTGATSAQSATKVIHAKAARRNTLDSIYFAELLEKSDLPSPQQNGTYRSLRAEPAFKQSRKRSMKMLRGSERDLKLDIPAMLRVGVGGGGGELDDRAESMPVMVPQPAIKVETCNRFMSLTSKLVACRAFKRSDQRRAADCAESRVDFYHTFALLIKMGSGDRQGEKNPRRTISREEHLWQNELKDLIWLELQAWHASRTLTEQDAFLCRAREGIDTLLKEIMDYSFVRQPSLDATPAEPLCCTATLAQHECAATAHEGATCRAGCLSMYCHACNDAQETALKEVEALLARLEAAEALYPSSKAFAVQHPLYKSAGLVGRVKAMCLWYNMTVHHRLKLRILGKLLMLSVFHDKTYRWPSVGDDSGLGTDGSVEEGVSVPDLLSLSRSSSLEEKRHRSSVPHKHSVQFDVDSSSPSDSNNSNVSNDSGISDRLRELYNLKSMASTAGGPAVFSTAAAKNPYRKYIEEVLKTRGLRKALAFLESLHTRVLMKSMSTLERPSGTNVAARSDGNEEAESSEETETNGQEETASAYPCTQTKCHIIDGLQDNYTSNVEEVEEMRRYGYWSEETRALRLPSYRSAFLFLSRIPLDVIHEFLRMRLEQKPNQPSVLSIRQLMRELKEGLCISVLHKDRYLHLVRAVLWDASDATLALFERGVDEFDTSVRAVLEVYLDYLQRWSRMVQQEALRKHLLEEEWAFVRNTCPKIRDGECLAGMSFCRMSSGMLSSIGEFLSASVEQIRGDADKCDRTDGEEISPKYYCMLSVCRDLQALFNVTRLRSLKAVAFAKTLRKDLEDDPAYNIRIKCNLLIAESIQHLKMKALLLCYSIANAIQEAEEMCDWREWNDIDEMDRAALAGRCREILHQAYKFGFEYHKEVYRLVTGESREKLSRCLISFAKLWMSFVKERCERGRGLRPRWANQGLDFLMTICEPHHTNFLTNEEFEELKSAMDSCISHVVGQPPTTPDPPSPAPATPSPRPSVDYPRSPLPPRAAKFKSQRSGSGIGHRRTPSGNVVPDDASLLSPPDAIQLPAGRHERVLNAVSSLDRELDKRLRSSDLIGAVTDVECEDKIHIRLRSVTFGWQRGIKIGQGSYGKVYTAVNNQTGELMAMKEIQLQPNDHRTIRRVAEELRIFEGIKHQHLVRYYGVEIHREEMLIFMEFCAEGTLESLVAGTEGGLPEALMRRYARQLLLAIATLHSHGVVHRDVKSANIFLTDEGNCLKLGDFGSAVKIKAHTTVPGELQGFVGTQAYMAPEVFMKSTTEGHGRAVDIWSIGCVVVEMASGERPWAEFDSNYQIMFKVGMGETPSIPDTISDEGTDFLSLCLRHDPRERATATFLLQHPFTKVDVDEENLSLTLPL